MKPIDTTVAYVLALMAALFTLSAFAGPGHDHDHNHQHPYAHTAAPDMGYALPRFAAADEELELVGIVNGKQVTLYLDRFADNSPVHDAQIELSIGGSAQKAHRHEDGTHHLVFNEALQQGVLTVTATIYAGGKRHALVTEFDGHTDEGASHHHHHEWLHTALWVGAGLLVLALITLMVRGRTVRNRPPAHRA